MIGSDQGRTKNIVQTLQVITCYVDFEAVFIAVQTVQVARLILFKWPGRRWQNWHSVNDYTLFFAHKSPEQTSNRVQWDNMMIAYGHFNLRGLL